MSVSADPPGGVFRDQPVVLTCEVSEVTEQVTLAWLSMERGRGVLVKQEVLTKRGNKSLSVTVNSVREEQVLWKCAVFTENKLRALVPITLHLLSTQTPPSGQSNHTSVPPKQGPPEEGSSLITMVAVVSAAVLGICILVAALVFCCNISTTAGEILLSARRESHFTQSDPPSINTTGAQIHRGKEDVIYSTVSASGSQQDPSSQSKKEPTSSVQEIIYSTINIS
ncbi:uncharacterized protein LOC118240761 [Electrophorus electricus]|uniref:uncharacterized protein LOC118240761 n=1 Tax=Electrophorus electricus TaxID=8005 RepID=UPI0015CFE441|nr:uncharacterized protein LOC118240761 [Electrophorus electricus]